MGKAITPPAQLLRVSTTRTDGGAVFGGTAKERWERFLPPDRHNRVAYGNYCMLLRHPIGWILVDTGPGDKAPASIDIAPTRSRSSLFRELRGRSINPRDIALVILTHLHEEHAGGATHCTSSGRILPTFPNARYIAQRAAWEEASEPNERHYRHYRSDDFLPLEEAGQIELVDGTTEVAKGVWVEPSPGPTAGHQIVIANGDSSAMVFLGALIPTLMHLSAGVASAADWDPDQTMRSKHSVVRRALADRWWMAPAGCDRWLAADELLDLSLWRIATGEAPEDQVVAAPMPQQIPVPALAG